MNKNKYSKYSNKHPGAYEIFLSLTRGLIRNPGAYSRGGEGLIKFIAPKGQKFEQFVKKCHLSLKNINRVKMHN